MIEISFRNTVESTFLPALVPLVRKVSELHHNKSFAIYEKPDDSPVTDVDKMANYEIRKLLESLFPGMHYVGEEDDHPSYPINADSIWFTDPIDGTRQFISGESPYFILIGLSIKGKPAMGIYIEPESGKVITGYVGDGAYISNMFANEGFSKININISGLPKSLNMKGVPAALRTNIQEITGYVRSPYQTGIHNILAPVIQKSSGYISKRRIHFWDLCAPAAIMCSLGWETLFMEQGSRIDLNSGPIACDQFFCVPENLVSNITKIMTGKLI